MPVIIPELSELEKLRYSDTKKHLICICLLAYILIKCMLKVLTLRVEGIKNTDQSRRGRSLLKTTAKRKLMNLLV